VQEAPAHRAPASPPPVARHTQSAARPEGSKQQTFFRGELEWPERRLPGRGVLVFPIFPPASSRDPLFRRSSPYHGTCTHTHCPSPKPPTVAAERVCGEERPTALLPYLEFYAHVCSATSYPYVFRTMLGEVERGCVCRRLGWTCLARASLLLELSPSSTMPRHRRIL
jgi:hypothetical protein